MTALFGTLWLLCLVLFVIGTVFLIIELCLPGFGVAGCCGVLCFGSVIAIQYSTNTPGAASLVSLVMAAIIVVLVILFIRSFNSGALFRSPIVLRERVDGEATSTATEQYADLLGKTGVVETTLRPSGTVLIDGKQYTVKARASFVEKGKTVTVAAVHGLDIVVE